MTSHNFSPERKSDDLSKILDLTPEFVEYIKASLHGKIIVSGSVMDFGGKTTFSFPFCAQEIATNSTQAQRPAKPSRQRQKHTPANPNPASAKKETRNLLHAGSATKNVFACFSTGKNRRKPGKL